MERLVYPYLVYTDLIYTMNAPEKVAQALGYDRLFSTNEGYMERIFGHVESIMNYDTYQFKDYSKLVSDLFDGNQKKKRRQEVFPQDCQEAYEMGLRFAMQR